MKRKVPKLLAVALAVGVAGLWWATSGSATSRAVGIGRYSANSLMANVAVSYLALLAGYVLLGGSAWKLRTARVAINLATLLLLAASIELPAWAGWVDYSYFLLPKGFGYEGPLNARLDPAWISVRPPYDRFTSVQGGDTARTLGIETGLRYRASWQGDRNGFRNTHDFRQAPVVLLGDSFIEGYKVPQESTCAARLGEMLGLDVCNLGQCDFGPCQELNALRRLAIALRPRVAVWFFFEGNDLQDIDAYEAAIRDWHGYVARRQRYANRSMFYIARSRLDQWLRGYRIPDPEEVRRHTGSLKPDIPGSPLAMYFGEPSFSIGRHELALLAKTEEILACAKAACDAHGIALLVALVPLKQRACIASFAISAATRGRRLSA